MEPTHKRKEASEPIASPDDVRGGSSSLNSDRDVYEATEPIALLEEIRGVPTSSVSPVHSGRRDGDAAPEPFRDILHIRPTRSGDTSNSVAHVEQALSYAKVALKNSPSSGAAPIAFSTAGFKQPAPIATTTVPTVVRKKEESYSSATESTESDESLPKKRQAKV